MFSRTTEYALRAVAHLAYAYGADVALTAGQIAESTQVPSDYLSKVLQALVRSGLAVSQRGNGGGFRLASSPRALTVYAVVQAVEPIERIVTCPLGLAAHGKALCPLHRKMDDALALIEQSFRGTTIQELIENPDPSKPLDLAAVLPGTCAIPAESKAN
jgi:Rrf2 family protein